MFPAHNVLMQYEREMRRGCVKWFERFLETIKALKAYRDSGEIGEDALHDACVKLLPILKNPERVQAIKSKGGLIPYGITTWVHARDDAWRRQNKFSDCVVYDENMANEPTQTRKIYNEANLHQETEASQRHLLPASLELVLWQQQEPQVLWTIIALTLVHLTETDREVWILRELEGLNFKTIGYILSIPEATARKRFERAKARFFLHSKQYDTQFYGERFRRFKE